MVNRVLRRVPVSVGLVAVLTVAAFGVAACGDDSEESSGSGAATSQNGAAPGIDVPERVKKAGELKIAAFLEYAPYRYVDENGEPAGIEVDLAKKIAEKMGVRANITNIDFAGLFPAVENGRFDFGLGANYKTVEREKTLDMLPWEYTTLTVVVKKGNPENIDGNNLCTAKAWGETVGSANLVVAEKVVADCKAQGKNVPKLREFQDVATRNQALQNGQISVHTEDPAVTKYKAEEGIPAEALPSNLMEKYADSFPAGWSFKQGDEEMKTAVVQAIELLIKEGTWQKILEEGGIEKPIIPPSFDKPEAVELD